MNISFPVVPLPLIYYVKINIVWYACLSKCMSLHVSILLLIPRQAIPPSPFNLGTSKAFHSSGCSTHHVLLCKLRQWLCLIHPLESSPERAEGEMQSFEKGTCKHYLQGFPLENSAVICQVGPGSPISPGEKTRTPFIGLLPYYCENGFHLSLL